MFCSIFGNMLCGVHRLIRHGSLMVIACAASVIGAPAWGQVGTNGNWPSRTLTIVVPFSAGGGVDAMARLLADRLKDQVKQPVVVSNKPGASGMLGAAFVAKATPDGYTLLLGSAGETAINPLVHKGRMQYQPESDLAAISLITRVPNVLVAAADYPANTVAELADYARKTGPVSYATSGVGNPQHLNGELLASTLNIAMQHVPYKGAAGQLVDVASGTVDLTFVSYAGAAPFLQSGRVKALAVTSATRASFAPDIPAIAETAQAADYELENWFGLFVPAATPANVQAQVNQAIVTVLQDPELARRMREQGGEPTPMSQTQFRDFIVSQTAKYTGIVAAANIVVE